LTSSLPTIGSDLNYTAAGLTWPVSLNALMLGAFLLPFGRVADIVGHRIVFLGGTTWFALGSLAVALAPDNKGFSALCALLGLGAAANMPAGVGILGSQ
jgi:MFS family permease